VIRRFVRGVIHNATVTEADADWPVALRIDSVLLRSIEVLPLEEVEIVNTSTGHRFTTWADAAAEGSGEVSVHAGANHHVRRGDVITIVSHGLLHDGQTLNHRATIVTVDTQNRVVSLTEQ
jgi:aspartate 1-decarboxylase